MRLYYGLSGRCRAWGRGCYDLTMDLPMDVEIGVGAVMVWSVGAGCARQEYGNRHQEDIDHNA